MRDNTNRREYLKAISATSAASMALVAGCSGTDEDSGGQETQNNNEQADENANAEDQSQNDMENQDITEWIVGMSQEGSPVNTWVQGMASTIEENSDSLRWSPQFVNGFRAALVLLNDGDLDIASSWFHNAYQAQNDLGGFSEGDDIGPLDTEVRAMLPVMHQGQWFYATYADRDDIETIRDLEGMTVGLNVPNAGVTVWGQEQFEIMGIADSVQFEFLSLGDVGTALQSRQVDAALQLATNGTTLTTGEARAWSSITMKGVDIPQDVREQHLEENDLVEFVEIQNENLNEQGDFDSVYGMLLSSSQFTTADYDADLVYEATKTLLENQEELAQYHPAMEVWGIGEDKHGFEGCPEGTVFHEGAVRYFEEEGIDYPGSSQETTTQ